MVLDVGINAESIDVKKLRTDRGERLMVLLPLVQL